MWKPLKRKMMHLDWKKKSILKKCVTCCVDLLELAFQEHPRSITHSVKSGEITKGDHCKTIFISHAINESTHSIENTWLFLFRTQMKIEEVRSVYINLVELAEDNNSKRDLAYQILLSFINVSNCLRCKCMYKY